MADSIFEDKNKEPTDEMLKDALGKTYQFWKEFKKHLGEEYGELAEDWKFYGQKYGWQLKILKGKRNLFFFIPVENYFKLTFVFGDKAVEKVQKSDLSANIKTTLKNAKKYMEGRGILIEIKTAEDMKIAKKLVEIKINN